MRSFSLADPPAPAAAARAAAARIEMRQCAR